MEDSWEMQSPSPSLFAWVAQIDENNDFTVVSKSQKRLSECNDPQNMGEVMRDLTSYT